MKRAGLISVISLIAMSAPAACNEPFSNEDLVFLKAAPTAQQLDIRVPQGLSTCTSSPTAEFYPYGRDVAAGLNGVSGEILNNIVAGALRYPPTKREDDLRIWGPWTDKDIDYLFAMNRVFMDTTVQATRTSTPARVATFYQYALSARRHGDEEFINAISGSFAPTERLDEGMGSIFLNLEEIHLKVDPTSTDRGLFAIGYDNRFGQSTVEVLIDSEVDLNTPFEKAEGYYVYHRQPDGYTRFDFVTEYNVPDLQPDTGPEYLYIRQRYVADQRGRADVGVGGGDLGSLIFFVNECWDGCMQRTFLRSNDPKRPMVGDVTDCAPALQPDQPD